MGAHLHFYHARRVVAYPIAESPDAPIWWWVMKPCTQTQPAAPAMALTHDEKTGRIIPVFGHPLGLQSLDDLRRRAAMRMA